MDTERIYLHKATGYLEAATQRPAVVTYSRSGQYTSKRYPDATGDCATVKAPNKSQIRKWCRQNGYKPQTYLGNSGDWTCDARRPLPPQPGPEESKGNQVNVPFDNSPKKGRKKK